MAEGFDKSRGFGRGPGRGGQGPHGRGGGRRPGNFPRRPLPHGDKPGGKRPFRLPLPAPETPKAPEAAATPTDTSWQHVAQWYDRLVGDEGSDYHRHVVLPAALRMLEPKPGERILDLCCGQGVFCRLLAQLPLGEVVGIDASSAMIEAAKARADGKNIRYLVADARNLGPLADGSFDAAACLMAVHDLDNLDAVFASLAAALKPGGRAVLVLMHPCFRVPRQSSWGYDEKLKTQYRRVDRYATPLEIPISTHPGSAPSENTKFFHRPLAAYLTSLGKAGLAVTACEELASHRQSEPGGRSRAENRARREIPLFLALKVVKLPT